MRLSWEPLIRLSYSFHQSPHAPLGCGGSSGGDTDRFPPLHVNNCTSISSASTVGSSSLKSPAPQQFVLLPTKTTDVVWPCRHEWQILTQKSVIKHVLIQVLKMSFVQKSGAMYNIKASYWKFVPVYISVSGFARDHDLAPQVMLGCVTLNKCNPEPRPFSAICRLCSCMGPPNH